VARKSAWLLHPSTGPHLPGETWPRLRGETRFASPRHYYLPELNRVYPVRHGDHAPTSHQGAHRRETSLAREPLPMSADDLAKISEWLSTTVAELVRHPDSVQVRRVADTGTTAVFLITVSGPDTGRVIGARGQTIAAIRRLVSTMSRHHHLQVLVDVTGTHAGPSRSGS
jgi:predicted RNA-binding protein YlqC (UPF0109 family)